jgi:hypothetical protein
MATKTKTAEPVKATPQPQPKAPTLPPQMQAEFKKDVAGLKLANEKAIANAPIADLVATCYAAFAATHKDEDADQWPSFELLDELTRENYAKAMTYALDAKNEARTDFEKFVKANCAGKQIL